MKSIYTHPLSGKTQQQLIDLLWESLLLPYDPHFEASVWNRLFIDYKIDTTSPKQLANRLPNKFAEAFDASQK